MHTCFIGTIDRHKTYAERRLETMTEKKRLYRLRNNRIFCGVCGGIGEYLDVDPNVIRIIAVLLGCTGTGLVAYIIGAIILPEKP